jgi:hypothetical protein
VRERPPRPATFCGLTEIYHCEAGSCPDSETWRAWHGLNLAVVHPMQWRARRSTRGRPHALKKVNQELVRARPLVVAAAAAAAGREDDHGSELDDQMHHVIATYVFSASKV